MSLVNDSEKRILFSKYGLEKSKDFKATVQFTSPQNELDEQDQQVCQVIYSDVSETAVVTSASKTLSIINDDVAGATLTWNEYQWQRLFQTMEEGKTLEYSIHLLAEPIQDVKIVVAAARTNSTTNLMDLPTLSTTSLTFTASNWMTPQNLKIITKHDNITGDLERFEISHTIVTDDISYSPRALIL